jgi:uncharacterized protein (DUF1501 family)
MRRCDDRASGPVVSGTRRDFLKAGALGAIGLSRPGAGSLATSHEGGERAVILLLLVGGPSQLETWDPKPDAPAEVRGPFGSIATKVAGVRINEHLPRLARRMDRLTLIRSMHHGAAPIHETGLQLLQTGRLRRFGNEAPHIGSVVARLRGPRNDRPAFVVLPGPLAETGAGVSHGQTAGALGAAYEPVYLRAADLNDEPDEILDAYGRNTFGQSCLQACRLVEAGVRMVTVNMFSTVINQVSWDCHGRQPFGTLADYARELLPTFDRAFSALLDDLAVRGLLDSTLVVATGEFGRSPRLNAAGGRDHWPDVWSMAMAGGGTSGGQVIGASDPQAARPVDRPVHPAELLATIYRSLGLDPADGLTDSEGRSIIRLDGFEPIAEAFA